VNNGRPSGSGHWIVQRVTAVALIPLGLWAIYSLLTRADFSRPAWREFLATPWHAVLASLFLLTMIWHSYLGIQVIIEDYVHTPARERVLRILSGALHLVAAAASLIAVLEIAQGWSA
jgi:succinate dehydrogenase / fumarate reductase membrane anchor subunit